MLPPEEKAQSKAFKDYTPGYLHIDTTQINLGKDKRYLIVSIFRATHFVYADLHDNKRMATDPKKGKVHLFVITWEEQHIEHRTTLVRRPWTNGMLEAMNKR